jgi:DedD protein
MNTNKDRRQGGWVSTVVTLVVLVVVGFLCGALAGFLWQEPGLVLAHLSGKTEPVEWSEPEPGPVAAEPPAFSENPEAAPNGGAKVEAAVLSPEPVAARAAVPVAAVAAPVPATEPAKPAVQPVAQKPAAPIAAKPAPAKPAPVKVAAVTPAGRFSVQVGAFADSAGAEKLASRLRTKGYTSYVKADAEGGGKRYRVRVGPVNARERAEELAAKLVKGEKLPTWIIDENKG